MKTRKKNSQPNKTTSDLEGLYMFMFTCHITRVSVIIRRMCYMSNDDNVQFEYSTQIFII